MESIEHKIHINDVFPLRTIPRNGRTTPTQDCLKGNTKGHIRDDNDSPVALVYHNLT